MTAGADTRLGRGVTTGMLTALLGFGLLLTDYVESAQRNAEPIKAESTWKIDFSHQRFTPQALNSIEQKFFADNAAEAFKFSGSVESSGREYEASVLVVISSHWKSQHIPEHCYVAQGYDITSSQVFKFDESAAPDNGSFRELQLVKKGVICKLGRDSPATTGFNQTLEQPSTIHDVLYLK